LTTHVLDTANGCPGAGIRVRLYAEDAVHPVAEACTNADGRCDQPLLEGAALRPGHYTLEFDAGDYFRKRGATLSEPPFLDVIEIAFNIADAGQHYHVPLLVSPWSYSTYRGS
jgi:5-hydroxyisourate hydrolase